jgi:hypothetical protein
MKWCIDRGLVFNKQEGVQEVKALVHKNKTHTSTTGIKGGTGTAIIFGIV